MCLPEKFAVFRLRNWLHLPWLSIVFDCVSRGWCNLDKRALRAYQQQRDQRDIAGVKTGPSMWGRRSVRWTTVMVPNGPATSSGEANPSAQAQPRSRRDDHAVLNLTEIASAKAGQFLPLIPAMPGQKQPRPLLWLDWWSVQPSEMSDTSRGIV